MKYIRIILLNMLIVSISVFLAFLATRLDAFLGIPDYLGEMSTLVGFVVLIIGLVFRVVSSLQFYERKISILTLKAQPTLLTYGMFSISRNPLYIGIVLIFLSVVILFGTLSGIFFWLFCTYFCEIWIRLKEEKYMEEAFGHEYREYKKMVPRWFRLGNF